MHVNASSFTSQKGTASVCLKLMLNIYKDLSDTYFSNQDKSINLNYSLEVLMFDLNLMYISIPVPHHAHPGL